MNTIRIWTLIAVAVTVAVLAGGWFVGVQPMLAAAASTDEAATSAEAQNQATQVKIAGLSRQAAKLGSMQAQDQVLQKAVPGILKNNTFQRRVTEVAALTGVTVTAFTLTDGAAYTSPVASTTPAASSDAATPAASASASAAPAAAPVSAPASATIAKTDPLITSSNFTVVPVSIVANGTQSALLDFSTALQNDERVFLIDSVVTAKNDDGTYTGTLGGDVYTVNRG